MCALIGMQIIICSKKTRTGSKSKILKAEKSVYLIMSMNLSDDNMAYKSSLISRYNLKCGDLCL